MRVEEVIAAVPGWRPGRVAVELVQRGPTNETYRVTADGVPYCVRIPRAGRSLVPIDRAAEYENTVTAATTGVGARVLHAVGPLPALVLEWIDGVPQTAERLRASPESLRKLADALRLLHAGPAFRGRLDVFAVRRHYRALCAAHDIPVPVGYDDYEALLERIGRALTASERELVPCHNDLAAENVIDVGDRFRIVDYEYSAMNDPCFELGNAAAESQLSEEHVEELVGRYVGRADPVRTARTQLWSAVANHAWTLWACLQQAAEPDEADAWAAEAARRFEAALAAFEGPALGRCLRDAARR